MLAILEDSLKATIFKQAFLLANQGRNYCSLQSYAEDQSQPMVLNYSLIYSLPHSL
jgi:hypothetical protein